MRTSLNKIKAIDDYLSEQMAAGDSLLFEANILLNNDLLNNVQHQRNTYALITQYSRKKIKDEIGNVQKYSLLHHKIGQSCNASLIYLGSTKP